MTSVTQTCRDLSELTAAAQTACRLLFQECYKAGIRDIFITETYRSQDRQDYLYEQGRTRPGQKVTWTRNSNHKSRLAWDIAVAPPKDLYDVPTLAKVGAIAKKLGITWGGYWPAATYDAPHFEIKSNWKMPAGYKLEGQVIVPSNSKLRVQLIVEDKKEELTVSEAKNLQSQINELNATIKSLQSQVKKKADVSSTDAVAPWAKEAWEWGTREGIVDGMNPKGALTREQFAVIEKRKADKQPK